MREEPMGVKRRLGDGFGSGACALIVLALAMPLGAQEDRAPGEPAAATIVVDDEIMALVAPVALYPDPLLAVILQAAMFPIDVVQANRFIERYQEDQTLEPSEEWDPSLIALLNYPPVLAEMNEHLDWTEAMGDAVYDELDAVQDGIQDLRHGAYATGALVSNDVQEVIVEEGIVQIRPTSDGPIAIPLYDGAALLASLQPVADLPAGTPPEADDDLAERGAAVAQREAEIAQREAELAAREAEVAAREQVDVGEAETVAEEEYAEAALEYTETAAADPYAASYAPAAPTYAQPPVYAAPPPPVTYAQPSSSGWGTFGTFLGGAAVGGLLGYAIFDDDDNNNNGGNNRRNDINIEDSTIVIGGGGDRINLGKDERKRVNADLRDRRDRDKRAEPRDRRDRERQVAALPERRDVGRDRDRDRSRDLNLPQRDQDRGNKVERRQDRATPAMKAPKQKKGAVADIKRPSQTKKEASRGKESRAKAVAKRGDAPQRQVAERGGGGGGKALGAKKGGKQKVKATSDRGKKSRGKKRG
jgi:hypothetical protein